MNQTNNSKDRSTPASKSTPQKKPQKNQVSLAGVAKSSGQTPKKRKKKVNKWLVLLIVALVIVVAVVGKSIYDAATAGPSLRAHEMVDYTVTPDNLSGSVSYFALGITGENATDMMDMTAVLCYDRRADKIAILQVPVKTYIDKNTKINDYKPINPLYVILSEVEIFLSEERGKIARRKPPRDLVTNLNGLLMGCYIDTESHQNSVRDPFVAIAPRFHLVLHSVKVGLRSG